MGYPFGLAALEDGTCTTPAGMQRILGSRWGNPGVIAGCGVSGRADMKWQVDAGAVVVETGTGLAVEVPVESTQVTSPAAPSTGTRRDYIYTDITGQVKIASSLPASGSVIESVIVPAGATATNQMGVEFAQRYALPVGASLGMIAEWADPSQAGAAYTSPEAVKWNYTLPILPTDRLLEFRITQCLTTNYDSPGENLRGSVGHRIKIDGAEIAWVEVEYTNVWEAKQISCQANVSGGVAHTVAYSMGKWWGSTAYRFRRGIPAGIWVWDRGATQ